MLWTGGYSGCDHCRGAWAQVYQVVLCCLIQDLKENKKYINYGVQGPKLGSKKGNKNRLQ